MKIYLVGGAVRDKLLRLPIKEYDYVVVGATVSDMKKLGYRQVGKEFPVFLHPRTKQEYALARTERKIDAGYKGFAVDFKPSVSLAEDLIRRDLTINAMAEDLETGQLIDPFGGKKDIEHKILRHVSNAFSEDPVRILRVGRFLARFSHLGFQVDPSTITLMQKMVQAGEVDALVAERVWKELQRALTEPNPEKFFEVLALSYALPILFPDLPQENFRALQFATQESDKAVVRFAVLLHDYGKDESAEAKIKKLCQRYRVPNEYKELAIITATQYQTALIAKNLPPKDLLQFFMKLDIFRREIRFVNFLTAVSAIARSLQNAFDQAYLFKAAQIVKSINVQELLLEGLTGEALAARLYEERLKKLQDWLEINF